MCLALACNAFNILNSIPTSPFVPGTGIARSPNCPACKSLRRFGVALVGGRRCVEIPSGVDHFQKDASQRFRAGDLLIALAALCIRSKGACLTRREVRGRAPPKTEIARLPGFRRHATGRSAPSPRFRAACPKKRSSFRKSLSLDRLDKRSQPPLTGPSRVSIG